MGNQFTTFTNCRLCIGGKIVEGERLVVSQDDGCFLATTGYIGGEIMDLEDAIIAPGFLELHTNGVNGFHYTNYEDAASYQAGLDSVATYYPSQGVTGFWATVPTVEPEQYQKILPALSPNTFQNGASLLGAHAEGPYLHESKPGAHSSVLFLDASHPLQSVYGQSASTSDILKLVTLAPDIPDAEKLIKKLSQESKIRVSLGHSSATYEQGISALNAGATCLTHTLNCMSPLHQRSPGLAGLLGLPPNKKPKPPFYTLLCDGVHLHPSVASLLFRSAPDRAIIISDSIELAGLPDGLHPPNGQIMHQQRKIGEKVTIEGTDTLVGSCITVAQGVKNMIQWSGCDVAEAVKAVTENVADFMGLTDRGRLKERYRADFVVLDDDGDVKETWIAGNKVWEK